MSAASGTSLPLGLLRPSALTEPHFGPGWGNTRPNGSWYRLGFPSGYVTDVLQALEALCALGHADDPRLARAVEWLLSKRDGSGRWRNEYAYNGRSWVDFERQGAPSKWVTLRACRVLKAVAS